MGRSLGATFIINSPPRRLDARRLPAVTMWRALLLVSAALIEPAFARCKACSHKKLYKGNCGALYKKRGSRWGEWGFAAGGFFVDFCESNTCCASNFDDCCDADDGTIQWINQIVAARLHAIDATSHWLICAQARSRASSSE